jgi:crossover junction endodeoxyribonuclease RusA
MKLEITLPWPPSVNHYYLRTRTNVIINKKGKEFREIVYFLLKKFSNKFSFEKRLKVEIVLFPPNKRKFDLDNRLKGLLDSIEYSGVFVNDEQIDILYVSRGHVVKNGKAEIKIEIINCHDKFELNRG